MPLDASRVSVHFGRGELGYDLAPAALRPRIEALASTLERVREALGNRPLVVTSGYRTAEHNATLPGASPTSYHLRGLAADFVLPPGVTPGAALAAIVGAGVKWSELILYPDHVHLAIPWPSVAGETSLVEYSNGKEIVRSDSVRSQLRVPVPLALLLGAGLFYVITRQR